MQNTYTDAQYGARSTSHRAAHGADTQNVDTQHAARSQAHGLTWPYAEYRIRNTFPAPKHKKCCLRIRFEGAAPTHLAQYGA